MMDMARFIAEKYEDGKLDGFSRRYLAATQGRYDGLHTALGRFLRSYAGTDPLRPNYADIARCEQHYRALAKEYAVLFGWPPKATSG
jgi:hypothetical protein